MIRTAKQRLGWSAAVIALLFLCPEPRQPLAEMVRLTEGQAKAAYLFNFAQYVDWPASAFSSPAAPLVITVLGKSGYAGEFEALVQRTVRRRHVVVREVATVEEIGQTHILFVGSSEKMQFFRNIGSLRTSSVLTVSDIKHFADAGGMIGLVSQGDRIGFEVNLKAARKADLRLSAHLLKLASLVLE